MVPWRFAQSVGRLLFGAAVGAAFLSGCGDDDDDGASIAQRFGVGAACDADSDCADDPVVLTCLDFKGGYCGLEDCLGDDDCPPGSACVAHDDGINYCFLICIDKPECNITRPLDDEANCSANITFVDDQNGVKACVPPTG